MIETITTIIGITLIVVSLLLIFLMFVPWSFGAPFQPSSKKETLNIIKLVNIKKGDKIAELGCGNGTLVIALAKKGAIVQGYEINPLLVWWANKRIKKEGLEKKAKISQANFWEINLRKYNKIVIFQVSYVMKKLGRKLDKESKKGTKVISNTWKFPKRKYLKKLGHVYLYKF
jgi:tRNA A58 N-methylase Trm61